jgi:hypothetical protein
MSMKSVNQSTVLAALEFGGGSVHSPHGHAVDELADLIMRTPGQTLGDHKPEPQRLIPTLEALAKNGAISITTRGGSRTARGGNRKLVRIALTNRGARNGSAQKPAPAPDLTDLPEPSRLIITTLAQLGGRIEDPKGSAGTLLTELAEVPGSTGSKRLYIQKAEAQGWISKDSRDPRTGQPNTTRVYAIELTEQARARVDVAPPAVPAHPPLECLFDQAGVVETPEETMLLISQPVQENTGKAVPVQTGTAVRPEDEDLAERAALRLFEMCVDRAAEFKALLIGESEQVKTLEVELDLRDETIAGYRTKEDELKTQLRDVANKAHAMTSRITALERQLEQSDRNLTKIANERDEWRRKYESLDGEVDEMFKAKSGRVTRTTVDALHDVLDDS